MANANRGLGTNLQTMDASQTHRINHQHMNEAHQASLQRRLSANISQSGHWQDHTVANHMVPLSLANSGRNQHIVGGGGGIPRTRSIIVDRNPTQFEHHPHHHSHLHNSGGRDRNASESP